MILTFDLETNGGNTKSLRVKYRHSGMEQSVILPRDLLVWVGSYDHAEQAKTGPWASSCPLSVPPASTASLVSGVRTLQTA